MSNIISRTALIVTVIFAIMILIFSNFGSEEIVYDCRDIKPEYPVDVQDECRRLMLQRKVIVI